jgi:UDP-2-acetamido-3-amino-2,3-dideoxy-glucuronate N-acetyltransferase
MNVFIHHLADVQAKSIGENTTIWQFTVILKDAVIGNNCNINCNCFIENDVVIGDNVTVKSGVQIWDGITLDDNVFVGPNTTFTNDHVPRSKSYPESFRKTHVLEGASIGANSTIIAGVKIGAFALIGAGAVVTKDIPAYTVWYGNPAEHKGFITKKGTLLDLNLVDSQTKNQYVFNNGELEQL